MPENWVNATPETPEERIRRMFPGDTVQITSAADFAYNCVAYAAGDLEHFWDDRGGFWPPGTERGSTLGHLATALCLMGFEDCPIDEGVEDEYEKVALFAEENGDWLHACKQLTEGKWSSKWSYFEDFSHTLADMKPHYGDVVKMMRRKLAP